MADLALTPKFSCSRCEELHEGFLVRVQQVQVDAMKSL
jgi:hypothetical protein